MWHHLRPAAHKMLTASRPTAPCLSKPLLPSIFRTDRPRAIEISSLSIRAATSSTSRSAARVRSLSEPKLSVEEAESSVARGTRYEHLCLVVLEQMFGMELERTGGASDRGIDLRGWWNTKLAAGLQEPERRIRIVAQCKCQDEGGKKMGPVLVREMEGVVFRASLPLSGESSVTGVETPEAEDAPLAGIILSSSGFSKQALLQVRSSNVPLAAMHVLAQPQKMSKDPQDSAETGDLAERCVSIVWNDRFGSPTQGLLAGGLEVRWIRPLTARSRTTDEDLGRPVIYRAGRPLR